MLVCVLDLLRSGCLRVLSHDLLDSLPDLIDRWRVLSYNLELLEELLLTAVQIIDAFIQVIHALRGHNDLILQLHHALRNLSPRLRIRGIDCPLEGAN